MSLTEKIKEFALDQGADFVGVASPSRFDGAPDFSSPKNLLPEFKSVIAFGIAMNRAALEAWFAKRTRRPQVIQDRLETTELDRISLRLSRMLEKEGFKTSFFSQNGYYNVMKGKADFSHKHAAVAAGMGRLGLSSNFVQNEFGAAVHLTSIITEAELMPDPLVSDDDNPCNGCKMCLQICPEQAMRRDEEVTFTIDGQTHTHQALDGLRCAWGCSGLSGHTYKIGNRTVGTWSYNDLEMPVDKMEFYNRFAEADRELRHPRERAEMLICGGTQFCGNCHKICVGSKKDTAALFKLHLNSGKAPIPDDPSLVLNLDAANRAMEKYHIPAEEIQALLERAEELF